MSHVDGVDDGVSYGVRGQSSIGGHGVLGISDAGNPPIAGVSGISSNGIGVYGISNKMIAGVGVCMAKARVSVAEVCLAIVLTA